MVSFTQPLFWQIRYLVTGLSKKNYKSSVSELHGLVSLYGYDAQVFFLRILIEEIEFRDAKQSGGGRDQLKIQLLMHEIKEIENEEQFGVVLCQAMEASRDGVLEDSLNHLSKIAKVQARCQLALAVACIQSSNEVTHREGAKFLVMKLREYLAPGAATKGQKLPESLLHSLLIALRGTDLEEVLEERERDSFFKQLLDVHPDIDVSRGPCAGLVHQQRTSATRLVRHEMKGPGAETSPVAPGAQDVSLLAGVRPCDILEEIGHGAGATSSQGVKDVLSLFPDIGKQGLAEIICMTVRTSATREDPHAGLAAGMLDAAVHNTWNDASLTAFQQIEASGDRNDAGQDVAVLIESIKAQCDITKPKWAEVFDLVFDLPDLRLPDSRSFNIFIDAYQAAFAGEPFPISAVLRRRHNTTAQLQFLSHAVQSKDLSVLNFALSPPLLEPIPGLPGAGDADSIGGFNHCWACRSFIEVLLELAEVEDYGAVRELFDVALKAAPEALLISLCVAEDRSCGGLRAELLEKLVPALFDKDGANSTLVQATLAERTPKQLTKLLYSMQARDPHGNLPKIMNILQKDELISFGVKLMSGVPTELSYQLALLGHSRGTLQLESWLREALDKHKDVAALAFIRFLRPRLQPPLSGKGIEESQLWPLPVGTDKMALCKMILDSLNEAMAGLSPEPARQARELVQAARNQFPALTPTPPPEAPPPPGPPGGPPSSAPPPPPQQQLQQPQPTQAPPPPPQQAQPALPQQQPPQQPPPAQQPPQPPQPLQPTQQLSPEELEESSNGYFSKIYTGEMSVPQLIDIMKDFAAQDKGSWKHEVYSRMIQNLFDECRFFPKYPPQELTTTGELFGSLINHDLVSNATNLGLALRCVLEALRRPMHTKMFRFGILALEQFLEKLPVWPQLCHHLTQIEHFAEHYPAHVEYAKNILKVLPEDLRHSPALKPEVLQGFQLPRPPPRSAAPSTAPPGPPPQPATTPLSTVQEGSVAGPPSTAPPQPPVQDPPAAASTRAPLSTAPPPSWPPPPPSGSPEAAMSAQSNQLRSANDVVVPSTPPGGPKPSPGSVPEAIGARKLPNAAAAPGPPGPAAAAAASCANPAATAVGGTLMFGGAHTVDTLLNDPELQIEKPPAWFCDFAAAIFNSLVKDNIEAKCEEIKQFLQVEYYPWLAYYLVKNRASKEVNFHATYIEFFEKLKIPRLLELVTNITYDCLRVLLKSVDQAVVSTSHRTVLKNLGYWLGQITLARNKPLKSKQMDLKNSLLDAHENGRLTAVLPLVCKVLEGVQKSKVYKLPNPWTTAIMSLLAEIHDISNLRTNLMFEVEVLCKHLDIKISDLKRSELLVGKKPPPHSNDLSKAAQLAADGAEVAPKSGMTLPASSSVFTPLGGAPTGGTKAGEVGGASTRPGDAGGPPLLRGGASSWSGLHEDGGGEFLLPLLPGAGGLSSDRTNGMPSGTTPRSAAAHGAGLSTDHPDTFIMSALPHHVTINPSIPLFQMQPNLQAVVPHAVDRAIKEVISAVVERSVTISCLTTREMVTKDFAMEPDENVLKKAAQLMVSSVAGSLALVTCREPLRVSLTNHLWQLLLPHCAAKDVSDTAALEQVVQSLSQDNLELGCSLIEKAVVDRALKEIEESINEAIQDRKRHRANNPPNTPYYNAKYFQANAKWPQALPDMLRPKPGPLSAQQLKVYKDFNFMPMGAAKRLNPNTILNVQNVSSLSSAPLNPPQDAPSFLGSQGFSSGVSSVLAGALGTSSSPEFKEPQAGTATSTTQSTASARLAFGRGQDQASSFDFPQTSLSVDSATVSWTGGEVRSDGANASSAPSDVQAAVTPMVTSIEQVVQNLLANPPLLPPIDSANLHLYKQNDALDACVALSMLALDHELVGLLRQVPHRLAHAPVHVDSCALDLAQRLFLRLYEAPQSVPQVCPPDTVSLLHLVIEVYLAVLDMLRDTLKEQLTKVLLAWLDETTGPNRYNVDVVSGLLRYQLVRSSDFDAMLAKWINYSEQPGDPLGAINAPAVDFAVMLLQRACLGQRVLSGQDFAQTVEALRSVVNHNRVHHGSMSAQELQLIDSMSKVIDDLRTAEPLTANAPRQTLSGRLAERLEEEQRERANTTPQEGRASSQEMIVQIFEEWHNMYNASPDRAQEQAGRSGSQLYTQILQHIQSAGLLRNEETMERFFRVCCEHAVSCAFRDDAQGNSGEDDNGALERSADALQDQASRDAYGDQAPAQFSYSAIDSFTRLIVLLMKFSDKVQMLTRALSGIARCLIRDCEQKDIQFNQRPYFRILLNLLIDVSAPDPVLEQANFQLLSAFSNTFHTCNPMRVPNFAFAWLELISNRMFMPKLLMVKGQRGWLMFQRLLLQLLYFLEPYLRRVQLNDSTRLLFKGTVRMLLVLLHDFPEFLCDYHFSFCDIIPIPCVQIRNLILSAFPRNMKLPDPFMPNLKVDLLPDIKVAPRILSNYTNTLLQLHLKSDVDNFLRTRDRKLLDTIKDKLRLPKAETLQLDTKYNVPLLNALLLYVGVHLPQHGKTLSGQGGGLQQNNPSLEIFMYLAHNFDYEGRYLFLSAIANHLRYPNTHTHYFSCVLLYLFADTHDEVVREQITRVLLERLIVHRPHPWGLLITFIELIKNRRYEFWNHGFVKCAPEVEKLFQSVAYTCLGTTIDNRQNENDQPAGQRGGGKGEATGTGGTLAGASGGEGSGSEMPAAS